MNLGRLVMDHAPRQFGELPRGAEGRRDAISHDGAREPSRLSLLAEIKEDVREGFLVGAIDDIRGGRARGFHAHVQWPVEPERKSSRGLIDLHRRHADVERHAIEGGKARERRHRVEIGEARLFEDQATRHFGDEASAPGDGVGVAIKRQHADAGRRQNGARIAPGAKCSVGVKPTGTHGETRENLVEEHGKMPDRSASGVSLVIAAIPTHSRAPRGRGCDAAHPAPSSRVNARTRCSASSRRARNRPGSQI